MKKIGIFGGTFDPIHLGHLNIAIGLQEAHGLDHILFVPAKINPLKTVVQPTSSEHRLKMLQLTLKDVPHCSVSTLELERPSPSYMIDTVLELKKKKKFASAALFLILGEDLLSTITQWKSVHELLRLAPPLIAQRNCLPIDGPWQNDPELKKIICNGITKTSLFDVSSTEIRLRVKKNLFCGHLLDKATLRYIYRQQLYM